MADLSFPPRLSRVNMSSAFYIHNPDYFVIAPNDSQEYLKFVNQNKTKSQWSYNFDVLYDHHDVPYIPAEQLLQLMHSRRDLVIRNIYKGFSGDYSLYGVYCEGGMPFPMPWYQAERRAIMQLATQMLIGKTITKFDYDRDEIILTVDGKPIIIKGQGTEPTYDDDDEKIDPQGWITVNYDHHSVVGSRITSFRHIPVWTDHTADRIDIRTDRGRIECISYHEDARYREGGFLVHLFDDHKVYNVAMFLSIGHANGSPYQNYTKEDDLYEFFPVPD